MFRLVVFLAKRENLTLQAFIDHYENRHVPLIASLAPKPLAYRRIYLTRGQPLGRTAGSVDFDAMTELAFADRSAYRDWMAAISVEAVAADEARFLDRSRTRAYEADAHGWPG